MNKYFLTFGVIILLVLIAAGAVYTRRLPQSQNEQTSTKQQQKAPENRSSMTSLEELLALGKSQQCTFSYAHPSAGSSKGTAFIAGDAVAVTFSTILDNKEMKGNMINDGKYVYTWTDESKTGFKMAVTDSMGKMIDESKTKAQETQYMDPNAKAEYTCSPWVVDTKKFVPPDTIQFSDFSEQQNMLENVINKNADSKNEQCAACENAPDEAKAACKQALGCQ